MATEPATPRTALFSSRSTTIALAVGLLVLIEVIYQTRRGELDVYIVGAQRMIEGAQLYVRGGDPEFHTNAFTYPPFFALVFVPLVGLPKPAQAAVWGVATWGAFLGVAWMLRRTVALVQRHDDPRARQQAIAFWCLLIALVGRHLLSIVEALSHDVLTLLLVTACVYYISLGRDKIAGICAGLAAACKATPILFAPMYMWQRRWKAAACVVLAASAATLLPDLTTPNQARIPWALDWYQTFLSGVKPGATAAGNAWPAWSEANQSVSGSIYRLCNSPSKVDVEEHDVSLGHPGPQVVKGFTLAAQLAIFSLMVWSAWPRPAPPGVSAQDERLFLFGQGAIIATAMPLLSPMSSKSHFGILLLPVAYCLAHHLYRKKDWCVALLLASTFLVGTLTMKSVVGHLWGRHLLGYGTVTWCALASFLAALRTQQLQLSTWKQRVGGKLEKVTTSARQHDVVIESTSESTRALTSPHTRESRDRAAKRM